MKFGIAIQFQWVEFVAIGGHSAHVAAVAIARDWPARGDAVHLPRAKARRRVLPIRQHRCLETRLKFTAHIAQALANLHRLADKLVHTVDALFQHGTIDEQLAEERDQIVQLAQLQTYTQIAGGSRDWDIGALKWLDQLVRRDIGARIRREEIGGNGNTRNCAVTSDQGMRLGALIVGGNRARDELIEQLGGIENQAVDIGRERQLAISQPFEQILRDMRYFLDEPEAHHACGALEGVHRAANRAHPLDITGVTLQFGDASGDRLQMLERLLAEDLLRLRRLFAGDLSLAAHVVARKGQARHDSSRHHPAS